MIRCNFCSDLAAFECSENSFCLYHRSQHDSTHSGDHQFKDVYCKLSDEGHFDFQDEINRRLKTLKDCRNAFVSATAEYIKDIQAILSQKVSEIDKLSLFYINLIQKEEFDKRDSLEIDKILSTRLTMKNLEPFSDNKFKDYIQQEIMISKEIAIKGPETKGYSKLLSNEGRFLANIIRCCTPKNIPERMLRGIMIGIHEEREWSKAKGELMKLKIVKIDENLKLWSIDEPHFKELGEMEILDSVNSECLKYCAKNFLFINIDIPYILKERNEMQEMLPHVEKIMENNKIDNYDKVTVLLNLAQAYFVLEYNQTKAEKFLKEATQIVNLMTYDKIYVSEALNTIGMIYYNLKNLELAEKFYLECLSIQKQTLPENHPNRAKLYVALGALYHVQTKYSESEKFFLECQKIQERILPENHLDQVILYLKLGELYFSKRAYDDSENFYVKCLKIQDKVLPPPYHQRATLYMDLGNLYMEKCEFDKAEPFFLECLKIQNQYLPEHQYNLTVLYLNLGRFYTFKAEYDKAEQFLLQCLQIQEQILSNYHAERGSLYMALGNLYRAKSLYNKAENFYLKSLEINEQILPEYHLTRADLYTNVGILYMLTKTFNKAEKFFLESLKIYEQLLPVYHFNRGIIYKNLGWLYESKAEYKEAEKFIVKYLNIREKFPSNNGEIEFFYRKLQEISNKLVSNR